MGYRAEWQGGPGGIITAADRMQENVEKLIGTAEFKVVTQIEPISDIPRIPPKNVYAFIATVANNTDIIRASPLWNVYKDHYEQLQKTNKIFGTKFPAEWKEFVSCIRPMLLDAFNNKTGEPRFNMMITGEELADFINAEGRLIQSKTVVKVYPSTIYEAFHAKGAMDACKKNNMAIWFGHRNGFGGSLSDFWELQKSIKPHLLKNNVVFYSLDTTPKATEKQAREILTFQTENKAYIRKWNGIMRNEGFLSCAAQLAKVSKGKL